MATTNDLPIGTTARLANLPGAGFGSLDWRLLDDYQQDFPLTAAPFARIADELGSDEDTVLGALSRLLAEGRISRIGAVFAPRRVGASTLAAMAVPPHRLLDAAARVSAFPGVNHNYEREHRFNLWFVVTAADEASLDGTLATIAESCELPVLKLPLLEEFHIDLGFALDPARRRLRAHASPAARAAHSAGSPLDFRLDPSGRALVGLLQDGLPLVRRPFRHLAEALGISEEAVLGRLEAWRACGIVKRFGVVVRHHELGYAANAMLVHDVPDHLVGEVGRRLGTLPAVTLCYRRPRVLPDWPYNLFCMIHGRLRHEVEAEIAALRRAHGLEDLPHAVLFSRTRFKQRGACYVDAHRTRP
jgi:DNA-binding Lrp family transcriptional regulator